MRNPLYVFTIIGVAGVGAQAGSITMPVALALLVAIVFYAVALQEQAFLAETFGERISRLCRARAAVLPALLDLAGSRPARGRPELVRRTFMDASLFLLAIPLNDLIQWLQDHGWLRVLAHLP